MGDLQEETRPDQNKPEIQGVALEQTKPLPTDTMYKFIVVPGSRFKLRGTTTREISRARAGT